MLTLYRQALHLRRTEFPAGTPMTWLPAEPGVLAFSRGLLTCIANLSSSPVALPAGDVVLSSAPPGPPGYLLPDTAAWLRPPAS
jgi:alpha-glucosidase